MATEGDSLRAPGPRVTWSAPEDGEVDTPRLGPFRVAFDQRLDPRTVDRGSVRIESGEQQAFLSIRFDPIAREIVATSFFERPLEPETLWRLEVEGVRDLDGRPLAEQFTASFVTGQELGEPYRPRRVGWDAVAPIFESSCVGAGCHGSESPALGLDLSSGEGVERTAIGAVSRQFPAGTASEEGARGALGLVAWPLVDVVAGGGRPATSYLLYKVLDDPHVLGEAMPPPGADVPPLDPADVEVIADWILAGAPTSTDG